MIRGKIPNCYKESKAKFLANQEIASIITIIGGGYGMNFDITKVMRKPFFTFEFKKTADLLSEMRQHKLSIAVVLDEYGATAGLITIEDLIEEIVGDIRDEYDYDEEDEIKALNEYEFLVNGQAKLVDLSEILPTALVSEDYDSVSGFIIDKLERLANVGDEVIHENIRLVVEEMGKNRIEKVRIFVTPVEENNEE